MSGGRECGYCKRARNVIRRYNMTREEYDARIRFQHGRCGICGDEMTNPQLDHDHVTGQCREMLCQACNTGLGKFKDNPQLLRAAARYVEKHRNQPAPGQAATRKAVHVQRQHRPTGA